MSQVFLTTSWDDGYPADMRLAELLAKYNIGGTFYIPENNTEGRPVIQKNELVELGKLFEIGGHTKDHKELTQLRSEEAQSQISDGKKFLEDVLGHAVNGFCYPRGGYNSKIKSQVQSAGFVYGRTIKNLFCNYNSDSFEVPTTIQFYPHTKITYLKNYIKHGHYQKRIKLFLSVISEDDLEKKVAKIVKYCSKNGTYCHIWGHSWEIEEMDAWDKLEDLFNVITKQFSHLKFGSNMDLFRYSHGE